MELDDCKNDYMWNLSTFDCECNKACKIDEHLDIKICSCKERLIGRLVLACEDKILNSTETWLKNEKVTWKKLSPYSHYFIGNYMLVISSSHFY